MATRFISVDSPIVDGYVKVDADFKPKTFYVKSSVEVPTDDDVKRLYESGEPGMKVLVQALRHSCDLKSRDMAKRQAEGDKSDSVDKRIGSLDMTKLAEFMELVKSGKTREAAIEAVDPATKSAEPIVKLSALESAIAKMRYDAADKDPGENVYPIVGYASESEVLRIKTDNGELYIDKEGIVADE